MVGLFIKLKTNLSKDGFNWILILLRYHGPLHGRVYIEHRTLTKPTLSTWYMRQKELTLNFNLLLKFFIWFSFGWLYNFFLNLSIQYHPVLLHLNFKMKSLHIQTTSKSQNEISAHPNYIKISIWNICTSKQNTMADR